jgi:hypothetical protein
MSTDKDESDPLAELLEEVNRQEVASAIIGMVGPSGTYLGPGMTSLGGGRVLIDDRMLRWAHPDDH